MNIEQIRGDDSIIVRITPTLETKIRKLINDDDLSIIPEKRQKVLLKICDQSKTPETIELLIRYYESLILNKENEQKKLEKLAGEDALTGLYTRRIFNRDLKNRCEKSDIYERRHNDRRGHFSLIIYDLNKLKKINDSLGHDKGDEALLLLSKIIKKSLGKFDSAYRIGGDEFASIHPNTTLEKAIEFAKTIYSTEVSIGISGSHILKKENIEITPKLVYKTADQAMYESKRSKNEPVLWTAKLLNTQL